jgi:hypothetical protein
MLRPPHQQQRCLPRAKQHLLSENNAAAESTPSASESVPGASLSDSRAARPWNCLLWRRLAAGISKKSSSSRNQQKKQQQLIPRAPKNQRSLYTARPCHAFGARATAHSACRLKRWRPVPPPAVRSVAAARETGSPPAASAIGGRSHTPGRPPAVVAAGPSRLRWWRQGGLF